MYPRQPEILEYLHRCANKYDLRSNIRFNSTVTETAYDESTHSWRIDTEDGFQISARFLVFAIGGLNRPRYPQIRGLDRFQGKIFHTARWEAGFDPMGKRIAIVGTGSSAVQVLPEIAPAASRVYLYQRSAPWILPRDDRQFRLFEKVLLKFLPGAARLFRYFIYWKSELFWRAFAKPHLMQKFQKFAQASLEREVTSVKRRIALTPDYKLGCKRIVVSDNFLQAMNRENIEIVTNEIVELTENAIVDGGGERREVDAIILGTGFRASDVPYPLRILGNKGVDLNETWKNGLHAYLGMTVSGYPNLFLLGGPNSGLGHNSAVFMLEAQMGFIVRSMRFMRDKGFSSMQVRESVETAFNDKLQLKMKDTVWESGCRNWYQDVRGRNIAMWPGYSFVYWARIRKLSNADFEFTKGGAG